jgi:hypothetical protein
VGGSASALIHNAELAANAATDANTASAIVARDASGDFTEGTITANLTGNVTGNVSGSSGSTTGNAATVTTNANLTGEVTSVGNAAAIATTSAAGGHIITALTNNGGTLTNNTTGSAATLVTSRAVYGNNFDGSAALTQVIASTYGGTGNGFTKFSGPTTSEKTFTLPDASATILTSNAAVTVAQGGYRCRYSSRSEPVLCKYYG